MSRFLSGMPCEISYIKCQLLRRNLKNISTKVETVFTTNSHEEAPVLTVSLTESQLPELRSNGSKKGELKKARLDPWIVPKQGLQYESLIDHYKKLSKFRLTSLVVITTMGGYAMAPAAFDLNSFLFCAIGTGLVSAAANTINQYHEVPFDSQMSRTKNRVIVTGQVTPLHAVGYALFSASVGLSMLYCGVNSLTAALGAGNFLLYTMIYTPMKRISIANTWIGSVVGAIPPIMGWAGCTGGLDAGAWIMAGLLYAWQFPHFNALSWNLRKDYSRAGFRMMAVTNPDLCKRTALRYTCAITGLCYLAPILNVTNDWFLWQSLPLNLYFTYLAFKFWKESDSGSSRKLFRFSLIHLPALMILFLLNKKDWFCTKANTNDLINESVIQNLNENDVFKTIERANLAPPGLKAAMPLASPVIFTNDVKS